MTNMFQQSLSSLRILFILLSSTSILCCKDSFGYLDKTYDVKLNLSSLELSNAVISLNPSVFPLIGDIKNEEKMESAGVQKDLSVGNYKKFAGVVRPAKNFQNVQIYDNVTFQVGLLTRHFYTTGVLYGLELDVPFQLDLIKDPTMQSNLYRDAHFPKAPQSNISLQNVAIDPGLGLALGLYYRGDLYSSSAKLNWISSSGSDAFDTNNSNINTTTGSRSTTRGMVTSNVLYQGQLQNRSSGKTYYGLLELDGDENVVGFFNCDTTTEDPGSTASPVCRCCGDQSVVFMDNPEYNPSPDAGNQLNELPVGYSFDAGNLNASDVRPRASNDAEYPTAQKASEITTVNNDNIPRTRSSFRSSGVVYYDISSYNTNFDFFDLVFNLQKDYSIGRYTLLAPHVGVDTVWLSFGREIRFFGGLVGPTYGKAGAMAQSSNNVTMTAMDHPVASTEADKNAKANTDQNLVYIDKSDYVGSGMECGVDTKLFAPNKGWGLFFENSFSLLIGHYKLYAKGMNVDKDGVVVKTEDGNPVVRSSSVKSIFGIVPYLKTLMGINFDWSILKDSQSVNLKLGFDSSHLWRSFYRLDSKLNLSTRDVISLSTKKNNVFSTVGFTLIFGWSL